MWIGIYYIELDNERKDGIEIKEKVIMGELSKLHNIGETVEQQLQQAGITCFEELKAVGAEQAWLKIQKNDKSACIHRLYALEGAIQGIKKADLSQVRKSELKKFYSEHKYLC